MDRCNIVERMKRIVVQHENHVIFRHVKFDDCVMYRLMAMLLTALFLILPHYATSFAVVSIKPIGLNRRIFLERDVQTFNSKSQLSMVNFRPDKMVDVPASAYIPLDDVLLYDQAITCDPDMPCLIDDDDENFTATSSATDFWSFFLVVVPLITPIIAFFTFELCAKAFSNFNDLLSQGNKWVAVDGGAYQARIIAPAINGLVVPAVALLFATLISTTITTLRQRQVEIRRAINMEAGEIRSMECLFDAIDPGFTQDQCRSYLIQYTSRIISECHPNLGAGADVINPRRGFDSELNGLTRQLNMAHGNVIPSHVADELYSSVTRLREQRTHRITALQSVYPPLHYAILVVLAFAECVAYLIETDQELLVFLNAVQLKILWSMLVGTFVACFAVVLDLRTPFTGSYQISASVDQLHTIKLTLQASSLMAAQKKQQQDATRTNSREINGHVTVNEEHF